MSRLKAIGSTLLLLALTSLLQAHGPNCSCGHDPYSISPPHGGILEITNNHLYVEVLNENNSISLYVYDVEMNEIAPKEVNVAAKLTFPRNRPSPKEVNFVEEKGHYKAKVTIPRVVHRYTLNLQVEHDGDKGEANIVIENRGLAERDPVDVNIGLYD